MQYRKLGKIGTKVSALGFGCMRLPTDEPGGKIKRDEAIKLIRKGIDNGINYIDTAWTYHSGESEVVKGYIYSRLLFLLMCYFLHKRGR